MGYSKTMIKAIRDVVSELEVSRAQLESWVGISGDSNIIVNFRIVMKQGETPTGVLDEVLASLERHVNPSLIQRPCDVSASKGRGRKKKGGIDPDTSVSIAVTLSEDS